MIFVDTNVFMYAVGRDHPLKDEAREFLVSAVADPGVRLCTSAEALQELLHAYIPVGRIETLEAAPAGAAQVGLTKEPQHNAHGEALGFVAHTNLRALQGVVQGFPRPRVRGSSGCSTASICRSKSPSIYMLLGPSAAAAYTVLIGL